MPSQLVLATAAVTTCVIILSIYIMHRLGTLQSLRATEQPDRVDGAGNSTLAEPTPLSKKLASALPDHVILPHGDAAAAFKRSMNAYWAQQECEVVPACVIRPRNVQQLSTAVTILKQEHDEREKRMGKGAPEGLFAVRGGGHSPIPGAASIKGGVVIDLGCFCEVIPSEDGSSVVIGAGAKWMDVSKVLDETGLAVVGGRNSAVGVGGPTLGGKILTFFDCIYSTISPAPIP